MPNATLSKGARKLSQFLTRYGLTQAFAAHELGVSAPTLHDWLSGAKKPGAGNRWRLERWTGGTADPAVDRVNAVEWSDDGFLDELGQVVPYRPSSIESAA